jgi:hypothetical protein
MGQRRESRLEIKIQLRIFGTDSSGQIFSEKVATVNVSRQGAALSGVKVNLALEEIIGVTYGTNKSHFRVRWIGQPGTSVAGHIGLVNIAPNKPLWDFPLPGGELDEFRRTATADRRKSPRLKSVTSVEIHPAQGALIWGKATDISLGGCYIEMGIPLKQNAELRIGLWLQQTKLWVGGIVRSSTPGFGIGVEFTAISPEDAEKLKAYLADVAASNNL